MMVNRVLNSPPAIPFHALQTLFPSNFELYNLQFSFCNVYFAIIFFLEALDRGHPAVLLQED
jgi:hypothetical protein